MPTYNNWRIHAIHLMGPNANMSNPINPDGPLIRCQHVYLLWVRNVHVLRCIMNGSNIAQVRLIGACAYANIFLLEICPSSGLGLKKPMLFFFSGVDLKLKIVKADLLILRQIWILSSSCLIRACIFRSNKHV